MTTPELPAAGGDEATLGASALRGGFWALVNQAAPLISTTIISVVAARVLGPASMGRQSFISFVALTATFVSVAGLPTATARAVGEALGREESGALRAMARWAFRISAVSATASVTVLVVVAVAGAAPQAAWLFAAALVGFGTLHRVAASFLVGARRWRQHSTILVAVAIMNGAFTVVVLLAGGGVVGMFVVFAVTAGVMALSAILYVKRLLAGLPAAASATYVHDLQRRTRRYALGASVPIILGFVVSQRSEFFFLERQSTETQIALYSIAFSITTALAGFPGALGTITTPSASHLVGAGAFNAIRTGYGRAVRLILLVSLPATALGLALGPRLVEILYGHVYAGAGDVLLVLLLPLPLVAISSVSWGVLVAYERVRFPIVITAVAALVDVALAFVLVPGLDAIGAAIANATAQTTVFAIELAYCARLIGRIDVSSAFAFRVTLMSALGGGCALLVIRAIPGAGGLVLATLAGLLGLLAAARVLRALSKDDADWLVLRSGGTIRRVAVLARHFFASTGTDG